MTGQSHGAFLIKRRGKEDIYLDNTSCPRVL